MSDVKTAPAFPITAGYQVHATGMTLRDWFAGQALAGISANYELGNADGETQARWAYKAADAMIAAREEGQ
ncbi:hypothetical protein KLEP181_gp33 [Paracoccus phage vB_PmaP_KLEP18-1]|nr:hypothetical protein KLEP181_gp33 [Paracoccus phage vB_PmaP_KLEP18-1]